MRSSTAAGELGVLASNSATKMRSRPSWPRPGPAERVRAVGRGVEVARDAVDPADRGDLLPGGRAVTGAGGLGVQRPSLDLRLRGPEQLGRQRRGADRQARLLSVGGREADPTGHGVVEGPVPRVAGGDRPGGVEGEGVAVGLGCHRRLGRGQQPVVEPGVEAVLPGPGQLVSSMLSVPGPGARSASRLTWTR